MATTRSNQPKAQPVSRKEFEAALEKLQQENKAMQKPMFQAWSNFFYAIFSNPKTTLAGVGAAVPVLSQAYQDQNWVLAVAGLSTIMTGAMATDARASRKRENDQDA